MRMCTSHRQPCHEAHLPTDGHPRGAGERRFVLSGEHATASLYSGQSIGTWDAWQIDNLCTTSGA